MEQSLLNRIKAHNLELLALRSDIKVFVQDLDKDLNERWEIFCRAGVSGILPKKLDYFKPDGIKNFTGVLGMSMFMTYTSDYIEIVFLDNGVFTKDDGNHIEFKESVMKRFAWEIIYDW